MRSTSLAYCLLAVFVVPVFYSLCRLLPGEGDRAAQMAPASIGLTPRSSLELIDIQLQQVRPVELRRNNDCRDEVLRGQ